jgi:hypothetical protein
MHTVPTKPPTEVLIWARNEAEALDEFAELHVDGEIGDLANLAPVGPFLPFRFVDVGTLLVDA